jgi:DNA-damage-inducible protein J
VPSCEKNSHEVTKRKKADAEDEECLRHSSSPPRQRFRSVLGVDEYVDEYDCGSNAIAVRLQLNQWRGLGMNTATLQVRLNHQLKKDADRFFSAAGLDTTTAVRMFLRQVLIRQAIPFDIVADDPFYAAANQTVLKKSIRQLESGNGKAHALAEV